MAAQGRVNPSENVTRAAYATFAAQAAVGRFRGKSPATILRATWPGDRVSPLLLERAAATGATTSDDQWAGALASQAVTAFLGGLAPLSAASRLIQAGTVLPLAPRATIRIPRRSGPATALPWVAEGSPIPVRSYVLDAAVLGPSGKVAIIVVASKELVRAAGGEELFGQLLRQDASFAVDAAFFSTEPMTDDHPGGLLHGITPIAATTGGGTEALESDLSALAAAITTAGGTTVAFVMHPSQAAAVAIRRPDIKLPVWPTLALPPGTVVGLDASAFVAGVGSEPELTASEQATVHMADDPSHIGTAGSPATVAAPVRSLLQTRCIALRLVADIAFCMRSPDLVAVIEDATW